MAAASINTDAFWQPRRSLTLEAARRHTRFIGVVRKILFFLAGLILAVMAYFIVERPELISAPVVSTEDVRMTNPSYTGLDGDGEPYSLTADYALQSIETEDAVKLINPVMTFLRAKGMESSSMLSKEGLYNTKAQTLELRDTVNLKTDDGYECQTSHARIHTRTKIVEGDEQIRCKGNFGEIKADNFKILDDYRHFVFEKNVTGLLIPEKKDTVQTPSP